jgi:branched-chain amino acid transport system permease protein
MSIPASSANVRSHSMSAVTFLAVALLGVMLAGPAFLPERLIAIVNSILILTVATVGLQITVGFAGQINLGQSALMGVGAFATAVLAGKFHTPALVAIPVAGIAAASAGLLFGVSAVRIKGFYLALTTIAAEYVFHFLVVALPESWLGGASGLSVPSVGILAGSLDMNATGYLVNFVVTAIMLFGAIGIVKGKLGRAFVAIRDDENAAEMVGIDVVRTKMLAFLIGAFYAGTAGSLWAYYARFVGADQFTIFQSVWMLGMIVIGGIGSIPGAILGVVVVRGMQELLVDIGPLLLGAFPKLTPSITSPALDVVLGCTIAAILIAKPKGLVDIFSTFRGFRSRLFRT